jgi:type II secretory ATPase GspE/PulE/Tfp pilus assembly ATPase PilB-like protein
MKLDQNTIRDILLKGSYIDKNDAEKAEKFVKNKEGEFMDYFMRQGLLTPDLLGQALAESYKVSYLDLNTNIPEKELVLKITEEVAKKFRVILFKETEKTITVTTDDPSLKGITEELSKIFPTKKISIGFSLTEDIDSLLLVYKKTLDTRFSKIIAEKKRIAPEIIDEIIDDALGFKASDIHFDPQEKEIIIRFRIDGVLNEAGRIPKNYYDNILNRVKVQSRMRTDEHFSAQDGAIRYEKNGQSADMRVSVVPTLDGEKIVIRLLAEYMKSFSLDDLGLTKNYQELILKAAKKPFGMILVVGPTGSGKTTTLYALVKYLNSPEINIATIEDPVEYKIPGVNHIQVNPLTNLTFAQGLRSIARQDPDVILVGEIRDRETADISVNAALTGHLLFSTFHANDAASSIPRFLEMGIEPFLLSSTLELVIAQRLVRKICDKCRYSYKTSPEELLKTFPEVKKFFAQKEITLYKGKGCPNCSGTGYRGRTAIFEVIDVSLEMQDLMLTNPSAQQIWKLAKQQGTEPLFIDGLEKVKNGITTLEELLRVAAPPEEVKEQTASIVSSETIQSPKIRKNKSN